MVHPLYRKRLLPDTDAQELARVKDVLHRNQIEFHGKTTVSSNVLNRNFNAKAASHLRTGYSAMNTQQHVCYLYVRRRDYRDAWRLAFG